MGRLHDAAKKGDIEAVQAALSAGDDIEEVNKKEHTPLHIASAAGHTDIVKLLLLERGADPDAEDSDGNTPLHLAAAEGHLDAVDVLLEKSDEDAENSEGNTPTWLAIEGGHLEVAKALLAAGADMNVHCEEGQTYLHQAARLKNVEVVKLLLGRGLKAIDSLDKERCTPLMIACKSGAWEIGKLLLAAKANVKAAGKDSWTPLHFCAQNLSGAAGAIDFAEALLEAGASATARTRDGLTPSMVVGQDVGKRSKKQQEADDDMRSFLADAEADQQEDE